MATTTFYLASVGESITVLSNSPGFNFTLNRNSGDQIPADAIIDSVSLVLSATYQYSAMRLFVTAKDGANMHDPRSTSGNSASSNVLEAFSIALYNTNFYAGLDSLQITMKGAGKGSASSDGNVFNMRSNCSFTLTVNWHARTACGAPANIGLSKTLADPLEGVTLSWNTATAGIDNPITGYEVWESVNGGAYALLQTISSGATSGSLAVSANSNPGGYKNYKVVTKGTYGGLNSGYSTEATLTTRMPTECGAPTSISLSSGIADAGDTVTLSWGGAAPGTINPITGYDIYKSTNGGAYALYQHIDTGGTGGSVYVSANGTQGAADKYKIVTRGAYGLYNSGYSAEVTLTTRIYTACGAPSAVSLSKTNADAGEAVTLSWGGAAPGTNNPIAGYDIYKSTNGGAYTLMQNVPTTATSGGISIAANGTQGAADKYKIVTKGSRAGLDSGYSAEVTLNTRVYTAPSAPTVLSLASQVVNPGAAVALSWSGEGPGTNNPVAGFEVHRATAPEGPYTKLADAGSSPINVTAPATEGSYNYYKVLSKGTKAGLNSGLSSAYTALRANATPAAPIISSPTNGATICNSRPRVLLTIGSDAEGQAQNVTIAGYTPSSEGAQATGKKLVFRRTSAASAGAQSISAVSTDTLGVTGPAATRGFTYAVPAWIDGTLLGGTNRIKAAHMNELRTVVNAIRTYYGMAAFQWAETITAGLTSMAGWEGHVLEIRTAIDQVASFVNTWDSTGTGHKITLPAWIAITGKQPIAAVMEQLRAVIAIL